MVLVQLLDFGNIGGEKIDTRESNNLFFVGRPQLVQSWMLGWYTSEEICEKISRMVSISPHDLLKNLETSCRDMRFVSSEIPELVAQIRDVGPRVVIATDNMDTFTRWTYPSLGLDRHWDGLLNSFYLRAFKSHSDRFFGSFLRTHNTSPGACLMIDDSEANRMPLTSYGIDYRKIERGVGLVPELKTILSSLQSQ